MIFSLVGRTIFILCFLFIILFSFSGSFTVFWNYLNFCSDSISSAVVRIGVNEIFYFFFFIVLRVSSLVFFYREFYLDAYNNLKFTFLTLLFFFSIIFLVTSYSFVSLMFGWDLLGVASLCLIMFYPNKNSLFNSFLTMFFNRLGDILLLYCLSVALFFSYTFIIMSYINDLFFVSALFFCIFTKRAQFPLSSWLPAAMSAPTPISAIVHSSTLVTAGIFILSSFLDTFFVSFLLIYTCRLSCLTFLLGGIFCFSESDFKKIIAFSTLSQISLIICIVSIDLLELAIRHMIIHAFFKTLLFCSAGVCFIFVYSTQNLYKVNFQSDKKRFFTTCLFISGFSIRGFYFSSAFYTKDICLEDLIITGDTESFLLMASGRTLTVLYTAKLFTLFSSERIDASSSNKNNLSLGVFFFVIVSLAGCIISSFFFIKDVYFLSVVDTGLITLLIFFPMFFNFRKISSKWAKIFIFYYFFLKNFRFSLWRLIFKKVYSSVTNDYLFFSSFLSSRKEITHKKSSLIFLDCSVFLFSCWIFRLLVYSFSLLERSFEDAKDLE